MRGRDLLDPRFRVITDLHSHILPDVDDGPATLEESLALARAFVADGVERVVATPHVSLRMPTAPALIAERVAELRDALVAERIPLVVEWASRMWAAASMRGLPFEPVASRSSGVNSVPPESGAPSPLSRPKTRSCSPSWA